MIRRYQHASITVSDLERSVAFYQDALGFVQAEMSEASGEELSRALGLENVRLRLATLVQNDCLLEMIEYLSPEGSKKAPRPCDVGCMHIALEVDDIHEMYETLSARGVKFNSPPNRNPEGLSWAWWCYMRDPDGVPIELVQIKP
jgi:catechol 2,3-dioxygenase-like lactoylglutathione lyase family enzyme